MATRVPIMAVTVPIMAVRVPIMANRPEATARMHNVQADSVQPRRARRRCTGVEHGDGHGEQEAADEGADRRRTAQERQRRAGTRLSWPLFRTSCCVLCMKRTCLHTACRAASCNALRCVPPMSRVLVASRNATCLVMQRHTLRAVAVICPLCGAGRSPEGRGQGGGDVWPLSAGRWGPVNCAVGVGCTALHCAWLCGAEHCLVVECRRFWSTPCACRTRQDACACAHACTLKSWLLAAARTWPHELSHWYMRLSASALNSRGPSLSIMTKLWMHAGLTGTCRAPAPWAVGPC